MEHKADAMDVAPDGKQSLPEWDIPHYAQRKQFWKAFHLAAAEVQMDEDPDFAFDPVPESKQFRFQGKNVFLTYSQSALTPKLIWDSFTKAPDARNTVIRMRVGEEKHQDGGTHFHVVAVFAAKLNLHTVACFDIVGPGGVVEHPNIRKFDKKRLISRLCYASKDGKTTDFGVWKPHSLFADSTNYLKKKADHEAWMHDSKVAGLADPFPFSILDTVTCRKPVLDRHGNVDKRRHWLVIGPPDIGKSRWVSQTFKGKSVYLRPNNKYPFEANGYSHQPVIIYDDVVPQWQELTDVCNVHSVEKSTYGESRYRVNWWVQDQARVVVILLNSFNVPSYALEDGRDDRYELFVARFNTMRWHKYDKKWYVF